MAEEIAGVRIPDSPLVKSATSFIRERENDLLFDHSRRVFLFGALQGEVRGVEADLELLYVGALFHDFGLTKEFRGSQQRFEVDGADAARDFILANGGSANDARIVWLSIALHTTPGIPQFLDPEIALVTAGVETDVLGIGYGQLTDEQRAAVTLAHPRPDFKQRILAAFTQGMAHRPDSTFGTVNADVLEHFQPGYRREDFVDVIKRNPWSE